MTAQETVSKGRRIARFVWFGISIVLGLVLGLLAGWSRSVKVTDTSFVGLRHDYKVDIVLMVAEIYAKEQNLTTARNQLGYLNEEDIAAFVTQAVVDAEKLGYDKKDLKMLTNLAEDLQDWTNAQEGGSS